MSDLPKEEHKKAPEEQPVDYKRYLILALSVGASLILGLLSFGGMYALWPALIPAASGFALSVVYEFEIYSQNLTRAFEKLLSNNYFEKQLPKYYLKHYFQTAQIPPNPDRLPFFTEYEKALRMNDTVTLGYLEDIFDEQINAGDTYTKSKLIYAKYAKPKLLHTFLHKRETDGTPSIHEEYKNSAGWRKIYIPALKAFALLTTLSMSLGTSYLLVEFFSLVPWLTAMPAVLPVIIVPLSLLGGLAYGLLTFNAVTNLMANNTVFTWAQKIRNGGWSPSNISMAATAGLLFVLALTLTICTAGTWWTIAQQVRPLFGWMRRMPSAIMGVINPIIMWFSSLSFNIENTSGTLHEFFPENDSNDKKNTNISRWEHIKTACSSIVKHLWEKENVLQWLNPFRPMLFAVLSLRYVLFTGHLLSIGVTADRIPKLSQYVSSFLGGLSEGFEDWDYFFGEHAHPNALHALLHDRLSESQGHNHDKDLPSKLVELLARPLYYASAHWNAYFSTFNHDKATHTTYEASEKRQREPFFEPSTQTHTNNIQFIPDAMLQAAARQQHDPRFFIAAPPQGNPINQDDNPENLAHLRHPVM
jgi:hypothetical protein